MARESRFLAFDLGAESGRALMGIIGDGRLRLDELHRFPNSPVRVLGSIRWDVYRLFEEIKQGLRTALRQFGNEIDGIGVDTWGVDFGLFGEDGDLLCCPYHYRDDRTAGVMDRVFETVPRQEIFERTGIQFLQFNTLFQLAAMAMNNASALKSASLLLFMPDLFNYWLTGRMVAEFSIATTSQCYDPRADDWARDMLERLGIPTHIMPSIIRPGTTVGTLAAPLVAELGGGEGVEVIAPAAHDTGSAVAAVPASGEGHAYISSGTWSLMGVELRQPLINERALAMNFTNEGGVQGTFRFLRNIMGLWLVQECRRTWLNEGEDFSYAQLTEMAAECEGFKSIVDPDAPVFLAPGNMPERIREFCKHTGQPVPSSKGEVVRCALDSLALRYRATIEGLEGLLGRSLEPVHIVGGGTQNTLLCQLAADAMGKTVIAGPVEATAIGNVLTQAIGKGLIGSLDQAREMVRNSFELVTYQPEDSPAIGRAYELFKQIAA